MSMRKMNMSNKWKKRLFEGFFWTALALGIVLTAVVILLGWWLYNEEFQRVGREARVHAGVALATGALALFTCLLWVAAAVTARFARSELATSSAVNSANLTLQLDKLFSSDRALRTRHGAVMFLVKKRSLEHKIPCAYDISPYSIDRKNFTVLTRI